VHGSQHAGDELVDTITLLHKRDQCRDSTFIVCAGLEIREDEFLEGIDLILQSHKIGDGLVTAQTSTSIYFQSHTDQYSAPFVRIIDRLQTNVLLILKQAYFR
jgi:hypothetical protein